MAGMADRLKRLEFRLRLAIEDPLSRAYDAAHGVETAREEPLGEVGVASRDIKRGNSLYRVTWGSLIDQAMRRLDIDHARYVFLDYGSGKGKAMLMAADYPFRSIIGLEYAQRLHEVAVANCQSYHSPDQQCRDLQPMLTDVMDYAPPPGPIVCFMCNPFDEATMGQVFDQWRARHDRGETDIRIMYLNMRTVDEMAALLDRQDWLRPVAKAKRFTILAPRG